MEYIDKPCFYGGQIISVEGRISIDGMDKILDIMDEYIDIVEAVGESLEDKKC